MGEDPECEQPPSDPRQPPPSGPNESDLADTESPTPFAPSQPRPTEPQPAEQPVPEPGMADTESPAPLTPSQPQPNEPPAPESPPPTSGANSYDPGRLRRLLDGRLTRAQLLTTVGFALIAVGLPIMVMVWRMQTQAAPEFVTPGDFGAVGDGVTDDTQAVQRAFDTVAAGGTVVLPQGQVFAHSAVLTLTTPDIRLTGSGTLLAIREQTSAVWVRGDGISLDSVTLAINATTKRWDAYEQMKLRIGATSGVTVSDLTIAGSAAAGVYVGGAQQFRLTGLQVSDTRADGIQMTEGSSDGAVTDVTVTRSGDDGVSVVSYSDGPLCERITITRPRVTAQLWGRGFAVVGGRDITFVDIYAEYTSSAGLYIASEANFNTLPVSRVRVFGGTLLAANQTASVGHGAVLLYNGQQGTDHTDIAISNVNIIDTRATAPWNVGLLDDPGASHSRVVFDRVSITGGPATPFATNTTDQVYRLSGWLVDGEPWPFTVCA